jgi:hypothetical protein
LLLFTAFRFTPVYDEPGHFVAGISHWQYQNFSWYRVNPPLPRMLATVVPYLLGARIDTPPVQELHGARPEFNAGDAYFTENPQRATRLLGYARLAALIWPLLGTVVIFLWSRSLWAEKAGLFSAGLWVFSPLVLANSQLILPDVTSASMGLLAGYAFRAWLRSPDYEKSVLTGLSMGIAQLTKFTLLVLVPLWLILWCVYGFRQGLSRKTWLHQSWQMLMAMTIAILVVNLGYSFTGTGMRLKDYQFVSASLTSESPSGERSDNRFRQTWLGELPIPLPENVLSGIDLQQRDFEGAYTSYLRGVERQGGWLHYYLYAYAIKEPLGHLLILALAVVTSLRSFRWRSELLLVAVPLVVFTVVSLKTGFNHHLRYALPAIPYMAVWCGRLLSSTEKGRWLKLLSLMALMVGIGEGLVVYPYSYAHFNMLIGGSVHGYKHLASSNLGWGQEAHLVPRLKRDYPGIAIARELLPVYVRTDRHETEPIALASLKRLS